MTEDEILELSHKVIEVGVKAHGGDFEKYKTAPDYEAILGWTILGSRDTLAALSQLGYAIVRTRVGIFTEIKADTPEPQQPPKET